MLPYLDYHSRMDPAYQIQDHPAVINRDRMFAFWHIMEQFDQQRLDENELEEEANKEKNITNTTTPFNMTLTQTPRYEVFHVFYIIYKMKAEALDGDPGLFRKDRLLMID